MKSFFIFLCFFSAQVFAQSFDEIDLIKKFDDVYSNAKSYWNYDSYLMHYGTAEQINDNQCQLGSSFAPALDGLLIMYETTKDFRYLEEFMQQAIKVQNSRSDKITPQFSNSIYWCSGSRFYMNARILWPLAHFVYIIQSDNLLAENKIESNSHKGFSSCGEFANYLNQANKEVMDFFMNHYWMGDECMWKPDQIDDVYSKMKSPKIMELNMQASFGCALIYMYLSNLERVDYGKKAVQMAEKYLKGKTKNKFGWDTKKKVLEYDETLNAYIWQHSGWRKDLNKYKEDIGHAAFDITFPILYNRYQEQFASITSEKYFTYYEMVRFHNTFIKLIAKDYKLSRSFTYTVDGNYTDFYYGENLSQPASGCKEAFNSNAKNWIELSEFDQSDAESIDGYIVAYYMEIEQYKKIGIDGYRPEGIDIRGLANLVKIQKANKD